MKPKRKLENKIAIVVMASSLVFFLIMAIINIVNERPITLIASVFGASFISKMLWYEIRRKDRERKPRSKKK
jgi:hypothetical protein